MKYSKILKNQFSNIILIPEDLLHLETFQIQYLPDRVPKMEFATLLRSNPVIHRFLVAKYPPLEKFIIKILKDHKTLDNKMEVDMHCQELLWEIADLIIYTKYPEVYNVKARSHWDLSEVISTKSLEGKVIIDAGAGSGLLAFKLAHYASTVFAVEPVSSLRRFIRDKSDKNNVKNIYTIDGYLHSIPLPDNSADVLMTSNAMGWNLEKELSEIERVLKPGAKALHLLRNPDVKAENPFHDILTSKEWKYVCTRYQNATGLKLKYCKTTIKETI